MKLLIAIFFVSLIAGCASMPEPYQTNEGLVMEHASGDKGRAQRGATENAKKYCKKMEKNMFLVSRSVKYQGEFDENTHNKMQKAGKLTDAVGAFGASNALKDNDAYLGKAIFQCK